MFVVVPGLVRRNRDNTGQNSFITMTAMAVTAIYLTQGDGWVRAVAWLFLAILAANAIASLIAYLLRARFAAVEDNLLA